MSDKPGFSRVSNTSADEQSMAQIREILFGEQSRQTEQHFSRLEVRLNEQERSLKALLDERVGKLTDDLEQLRNQLGEQDQRQHSALDELNGTLSVLLGKLDERLVLLDSDQQDAKQDQQRAVTEQRDALHDLEQRSMGRQQLAELLEAMAGELRQSPKI
jgi:regulator of replication initiation timing